MTSTAHRAAPLAAALGLTGALAMAPAAPALAEIDPLIVPRTEIALRAGPTEEAFRPLEEAILGSEATPAARRDLLGDLARLRSLHGYHVEAAEALWCELQRDPLWR